MKLKQILSKLDDYLMKNKWYSFSYLGSGRRTELGAYGNIGIVGYLHTITSMDNQNSAVRYTSNSATYFNPAGTLKIKGFSIRLIKA